MPSQYLGVQALSCKLTSAKFVRSMSCCIAAPDAFDELRSIGLVKLDTQGQATIAGLPCHVAIGVPKKLVQVVLR